MKSTGLALCLVLLVVPGLATGSLAQSADTKPAPAAATPPPTPVAFEKAVLKAAGDVIKSAGLDPTKTYELVIDPLVDGKTGSQVKATQIMEDKILGLLAETAPNVKLVDFSLESLDRKPLLLIGSLTLVNNAGDPAGAKDAFALWFKLADLSTGLVLGGGRARSTRAGVDLTPAPLFSESPVWTNDPVTAAYIKSCSKTNPGEPLDPAYVERLRAAALIEDGIDAYDAGDFAKSLAVFQQASGLPGGDQLRTWNGIYLSAWKLGQEALARDAFGKALSYGFANDRVAVKFLFEVGQDAFVNNATITAPYAIWLDEIASTASAAGKCLELIGHASPTGPAAYNDALSERRAEKVRTLLGSRSTNLAQSSKAIGAGYKEPIIGSGADDLSDALDRRVELKIRENCAI